MTFKCDAAGLEVLMYYTSCWTQCPDWLTSRNEAVSANGKRKKNPRPSAQSQPAQSSNVIIKNDYPSATLTIRSLYTYQNITVIDKHTKINFDWIWWRIDRLPRLVMFVSLNYITLAWFQRGNNDRNNKRKCRKRWPKSSLPVYNNETDVYISIYPPHFPN